MKKVFLFLSSFAFIILAFASVWLGGLNQDEGWYLYAAKLLNEGRILYADFDFTQAPLLPTLYGCAMKLWDWEGLLSARIFTLLLGLISIIFSCSLVRFFVKKEEKNIAALGVFILLANNLYHLYYLTIPKTYALATLCVAIGFFLLSYAFYSMQGYFRSFVLVLSGFALACAAGTRISLGCLLALVGFTLLIKYRTCKLSFLWFGIGGILALSLIYGPYLINPSAREGLLNAQKYHVARGGFDIAFIIGSFSRLIRAYMPVFILFGLGIAGLSFNRNVNSRIDKENDFSFLPLLCLGGFLLVFIIQMCAPFPYEDYQVPVMNLLAVGTVYLFCKFSIFDEAKKQIIIPLLILGLTWANSFSSPLLEKWSTNGQDRFWTRMKEKSELAHLREVGREINELDPNGKTLLTQDLYLAIETKRSVPKGLEMGPFSIMSRDEWMKFLENVDCNVAALSGYTFAIEPPNCNERDINEQLEFWGILKKRYNLVKKEDFFGQQSTPLLLLKR